MFDPSQIITNPLISFLVASLPSRVMNQELLTHFRSRARLRIEIIFDGPCSPATWHTELPDCFLDIFNQGKVLPSGKIDDGFEYALSEHLRTSDLAFLLEKKPTGYKIFTYFVEEKQNVAMWLRRVAQEIN